MPGISSFDTEMEVSKTKLGMLAILTAALVDTHAQSAGVSYPATDDLGRSLPTYDEVGPVRSNKVVALFYWTWHVGHSQNSNANDLSKIMTDPAMVNDYDHPNWLPYLGTGSFSWGESIFDFYDGKDPWVIRKQLEMLGAAGVDVLFYDATNGSETWKEGYEAAGEVMAEMRSDGVAVPQFAFMLNFHPADTTAEALVQLYDELYSLGKYQDSWFLWKGKPVIMAYPEVLDKSYPSDSAGSMFTAPASFSGIHVRCPSYSDNDGRLTLSLYAWSSDYETSVEQPALAGQTFIDFADNAWLELEFASLPAGNYVWELTDADGTVGVWKYPEETAGIDSYFNGVSVSGDYMSRIKIGGSYSALAGGSSTVPVKIAGAIDPAKEALIKDFFTFRPGQPAYEGGPTRPDQWGWLENAPQNGYVDTGDGRYEWGTVGVAQNWSESLNKLSAMNGPDIHGRSYTHADGFSLLTTNSYLYGYNFQEQWNHALAMDPDMIFITGWNEWRVGRYETWQGVENAFPDEFSPEYSRDIEPMKGGLGDNYYYQMIANIRKFKGMEKPEESSPRTTIVIDGAFSDWTDVLPRFKASRGNVQLRDGYGYLDSETGDPLHYTNDTARNDVIASKAACDEDFVYFYVETASNMTSCCDTNWMQLLIDADRNKSTGWEGYEFRIGPYAAGGTARLAKSSNDWNWAEVAHVDFNVVGNQMEMAVPRTFLDAVDGLPLDLEFKWIDNYNQSGDIMDFYVCGEAAPPGRFNYRYTESPVLFKDTFEGPVVWDDLSRNLSARQADGRVGSTYTVSGTNFRTLIDSSVSWGNTNVLLGRVDVSDGGGGELIIGLDTDFGPDVAGGVWSLSFNGQIAASVGFSGWSGFSIGGSGADFSFAMKNDGTFQVLTNGTSAASGAVGHGIASKVYTLTAVFDEAAHTVQLSFSDSVSSNLNLGTFPAEFVDDSRSIELKNHVDSSTADGIVDMRRDDLTLKIISPPEVPFYTKWAEGRGLADADYAADPDGDGMNNLLEYSLGGNPGVGDAATGQPVGAFTMDGGRYVYTRRRDAVARGLRYSEVYKLNLMNPEWIPFDEAWDSEVSVLNRYFESVSTRFSVTNSQQCFIRLEVSKD